MPKQKLSNNSEIENICITNGSEVQNNIAVRPVFAAFVVANMIAFSSMGGINGKTSLSTRCFEKIYDMTIIEYPLLNVGVVQQKKKKKIESSHSLFNKEDLFCGKTSELVDQNENAELRRKNMMLKNRLINSIPIHTMVYMVANSVICAISSTLLFVRFVLNVYIIDPYYLICALIISIGLFFTALVSLKDWKDNLLNEEIR